MGTRITANRIDADFGRVSEFQCLCCHYLGLPADEGGHNVGKRVEIEIPSA